MKLLDRYVPLPNTPDGRMVSLVSHPTDNDQYLGRVDHSFSRANSFNLRFFRDDSKVLTQSGNISPYSPNNSSLLVDNWALHDTHTFSPSLLNEFHAVNRASTATNAYITFDGSTAGNAFADFLIGKRISSDQSSLYDRGVNGHNWFIFAQDDRRVSRKLTLNLGLRYEYAIPFYQGHDWTNTYRQGQQSTVTPTAPLGMVFPGDTIRAFYGLFYEDFGATNSIYAAVNQPFDREALDLTQRWSPEKTCSQ